MNTDSVVSNMHLDKTYLPNLTQLNLLQTVHIKTAKQPNNNKPKKFSPIGIR